MSFYDDTTKQFSDSDKCVCCDNEPDAMWQGATGQILICSPCAVEVLPKLIADALTKITNLKTIGADHVYSDWKKQKEIQISFDRGFECAIARKINNHFKNI